VAYLAKSKTAEATLNVDRIFEGAVSYYDNEHASRTPGGGIQTKCLPASVSWTPAGAPAQGWGQKYLSSSHINTFNTNTSWKTLKFNVQDNFYYQYSFDNSSSGCGLVSDMTTVLECNAQGDLDSDGIWSLFVRSAGLVSGSIQGSSGVYKSMPSE